MDFSGRMWFKTRPFHSSVHNRGVVIMTTTIIHMLATMLQRSRQLGLLCGVPKGHLDEA